MSDLAGAWRLTRVIEDRRAGLTGQLTGTCRWVPDGPGLRQEEVGVLTYGSAPPMQASRVYLWRADGDGLAVFFEDGRPFHRLGPGRTADRHWCDPDTYDVTYDLGGWPVWQQAWTVTGPRKDALIVSRFAPADAGPGAP
nr:DUF6314 family protein [Roseibacterium persicicum]